ncbi:MAG: hypothetical protein J6W82_12410 [Bacteroidales bacterium]|nr:hypothetical protein [Bacteroidales bacterium]
MIEIRNGGTVARLADPRNAEPYYRGTRFDRTGIVLELLSHGHCYVSPWFKSYDPYKHDAVCGPSEEFTQSGYEPGEGGKPFLKPGVGLLAADGLPYDRFRLYRILDPGRFSLELTGRAEAVFGHELDGHYAYSKLLSLPEEGHLRLEHEMRNTGTRDLGFYVYNHNFFVLDGAFTGRATGFRFPFKPEGDWRAPYDCVALTGDGIAFSRDLEETESVFMGNLHPAAPSGGGHSFELRNAANGLGVRAECDAPMEYAVFWSNHEVSCIEPYIRFDIPPGASARWSIDYRLI